MTPNLVLLLSCVLAFSTFALVEYLVAGANMYFYWTVVCDLPTEQVVVLQNNVDKKDK